MGSLNQNILVSVIVPVYNVEKYLEQCLDSIINQDFREIEIIAVNYGSTDSSPKILGEYLKKDARIKVVNQKENNLGKARNTGLKHANGEYIIYINSNDFIEENMISKLYKKAKTFNLDVAISNFWIYDEDGDDKEKLEEYRDIGFMLFLKNKVFKATDYPEVFNLIATSDKMYKKEFLVNNDITISEQLYYQDRLYTVETLFKAEKIGVISDKLFNCRKSNKDLIKTIELDRMEHKEEFMQSMKQTLEILRSYDKYYNTMQSYLANFINFTMEWHITITDENEKLKLFKELQNLFRDVDYRLAKSFTDQASFEYMRAIENGDFTSYVESIEKRKVEIWNK